MRLLLPLVLLCGYVSAHQFIPTYPELRQSYMPGLYQAEMQLFNSRKEIEYYSVDVFDGSWNPIPFATEDRIRKVPYLGKATISIFIREQDKERVRYICSRSKILAGFKQSTAVDSKICSKIK